MHSAPLTINEEECRVSNL